jgi:hypothetical protein
MHITFDQAMELLSTVLTIVAALLGNSYIKNARLRAIMAAVAAAEHLIDRAAYNDDQLNEARIALAIKILQRVAPNINPDKAKADIEKFLEVVHSHAAMAPISAQQK